VASTSASLSGLTVVPDITDNMYYVPTNQVGFP